MCIHHTAGPVSYYQFKPWNIGRWSSGACLRCCSSWRRCCSSSSLALTMLSQIGYLIIICLSYNMLLGQGGMLSFGHAVYTGLGSFLAIHAMNMVSKGSLPVFPGADSLVGGLAGACSLPSAGLCDHQEIWHHLCHDHAGCGRAGGPWR
jgi:branched-chain amino acid transport system permease protein